MTDLIEALAFGHRRPLYRSACQGAVCLTVVWATSGQSISVSEAEAPELLLLVDDGPAEDASPLMEGESVLRIFMRCELIVVFARRPTPLDLHGIVEYLDDYGVHAAVVETCPERERAWLNVAAAANAGDTNVLAIRTGQPAVLQL